MRVGIAHHYGWAVAVTASANHEVIDRRRIDLIEPGLAVAPVHYESKRLEDAALAALVADVRASAQRATSKSLDQIVVDVPERIVSLSLRAWPADFPEEISIQRRVPYESRADSVMYRQELERCARVRGWEVYFFEGNSVEDQAKGILGDRGDEVLYGPRAKLGPPWTRDHRIALAATIVAEAEHEG